ncbi:MAG: hypothetical protein AABZ12_10695, partial [Planctomycetota bacterium]
GRGTDEEKTPLHAVAVLIGASSDRRCTSFEASDRYEPDQQRGTNKETGSTSRRQPPEVLWTWKRRP